MYIGNHAVLYQDKISNDTERTVAGLSQGGCDGIEVGKRFFGNERRQELKEVLDRYGLWLSAFHISAMAVDLFDNQEETVRMFDEGADFLQDFPFKNIMFTPFPAEDFDTPYMKWDVRLQKEDTLNEWAKRLDAIAVSLERRGVSLHFHNHNWEFANGGKWFYAVAKYAPHVHLGLDIGWVYVAGFNPMDIIRKYGNHINYVHLRDLHLEKAGKNQPFSEIHKTIFEDIGDGDAPLPEILALLDQCMDENGWVTVEYEFGDQSYSRYEEATHRVRKMIEELKGRD